ncbi:hypothetical protein BHJ80_22110 [Escherichia coli]|nr:hypothetical protein BHJ80_22110 [Escherichia coli]
MRWISPLTSLKPRSKRHCSQSQQRTKSRKWYWKGTLLVLSDRNIAKDRLLAWPLILWKLKAIQTRLVDQSLRCDANIIVETASARDPHHFAVLLGFGRGIGWLFLPIPSAHETPAAW